MTATVNRRDIRLEEEVDDTDFALTSINYLWTATLDGPLSTGERVEMSRSGATSADALAALEGAIVENGWTIA